MRLEPVEVIRDGMGQFVHPTYHKYWADCFGDVEHITNEQYHNMLDELGVVAKHIYLSCDDIDYETVDHLMEQADITEWNPTIPEGYFVVGYWFTEDDAVAVFAKHKN